MAAVGAEPGAVPEPGGTVPGKLTHWDPSPARADLWGRDAGDAFGG